MRSKPTFLMKAFVLVALIVLAGCSALPVPQTGASSLPTAASQTMDAVQPAASPTTVAQSASPTLAAAMATASTGSPTATAAASGAAATPTAGFNRPGGG